MVTVWDSRFASRTLWPGAADRATDGEVCVTKQNFESPELGLHRFDVDEIILTLSFAGEGDGGSADFDDLFGPDDGAITSKT